MTSAQLDNIPQEIWQHLAAGNGAWRVPILASALPGGGADARTVVLRETEPEERQLTFFTDRRSRKFTQLQADPVTCLVIYDAERQLQVRLYGRARREMHSAMLDAFWQQLGEHQRAHYELDMLADGLLGHNEKGRENFAAFRIVVDRFHCLWIRQSGNEAIEFTWHGSRWNPQPVRP